ncbi:response regulator [Winogradskyella haliclonae]|uniref:DNA-binding response regulator n=1 Tax=Winogradskyella haliclonae TaxID=2048558 RepID=A0ABQ2BX14_9FLAO|nr:response regulator transcription factor [Winogradskyella haliclonae]GGI56416.1 DNA-binding response regulator [Winogradskyella haliclonae]
MNKEDITIITADDHPMLLKGLNDELEKNGYSIIGQANNGIQALELILKLHPTLALLDIDMPMLNGFEVIKLAREKGSKTKFIILSFHKESYYLVQAKTFQINGYLLKEDSFFEIEHCINEVVSGNVYFSKSIDSQPIIEATEELKRLSLLTLSEIKILKLIAQEISNQEIANTLSLSIRTIEKHRSNIIEKLGLKKGNNALTNWSLVNRSTIFSQ